ncbi:hypothetical protein MFRU_002g00700 [Monilinia fructicola]|uniref:Uncharacterized protein n=1 Tax=Monilinia fructicola TaxID=38448 RepID=A0A5M9K0Z1_MONFR|nr:hypothetical protein EYC84_004622 [Monilinia fructicola]KAG4034717.1 hypothetical protein MFRU_002g00700 [Monilinia fructicola]
MMDPKKYDELIEQEEYFSEKYGFVISVDHTNGPDSHYFTDREIHNVAMTVFGDTYVVRNHLVFRSDAKGAFYKQIDAITSARIQLVDYFKEIEAKGFMSYDEEYAFITCGGLEDLRLSETLSQDLAYVGWLDMRRRDFAEIQ